MDREGWCHLSTGSMIGCARLRASYATANCLQEHAFSPFPLAAGSLHMRVLEVHMVIDIGSLIIADFKRLKVTASR